MTKEQLKRRQDSLKRRMLRIHNSRNVQDADLSGLDLGTIIAVLEVLEKLEMEARR